MPLEENTVLKAWVTATSECEPVEPEAAAADVTRADIEQVCQALEAGIVSDLIRDPAGLAYFAWQVAELSTQPEVVTRHAAATFVDVCLRDGLNMRRRADQVAQALEVVGGGMPADWASQALLVLGDAVNPRISLSAQKKFIDPLEPELQISQSSTLRLMELPYVEEFDGEPCIVGYADLYGQDELLAPVQHYTRAYEVAETIDEPDGRCEVQVQALARLGHCLLANGEEAAGVEYLQQAVDAIDGTKSYGLTASGCRQRSRLLTAMAEHQRSRKNLGDALRLQEEAVASLEPFAVRNPRDASRVCWLQLRLSQIQGELGETAASLAAAERALELGVQHCPAATTMLSEIGTAMCGVLDHAPTVIRNSSLLARSLPDYPHVLRELLGEEPEHTIGKLPTPWAADAATGELARLFPSKDMRLRAGRTPMEQALLAVLNADEDVLRHLMIEYDQAALEANPLKSNLLLTAAALPTPNVFRSLARAMECLMLLQRIAAQITAESVSAGPSGEMQFPGFAVREVKLLKEFIDRGTRWHQYEVAAKRQTWLGDRTVPEWEDMLADDEQAWLCIGAVEGVPSQIGDPEGFYHYLYATQVWSYFSLLVAAVMADRPSLCRCEMPVGRSAYLDHLLGERTDPPPTCGRFYLSRDGAGNCGRPACEKVYTTLQYPQPALSSRAYEIAVREWQECRRPEDTFPEVWADASVPDDPKASLLRFRQLLSRSPRNEGLNS